MSSWARAQKRAVEDADDAERADQRRAEAEAGVGRQRHAQPQKAVDADLEQDAGQQHAAGGRRLDVGQRQPGVQREQRHLDGEADHHGDEHPELDPAPEGQPVFGPLQLLLVRACRTRRRSAAARSVVTSCGRSAVWPWTSSTSRGMEKVSSLAVAFRRSPGRSGA